MSEKSKEIQIYLICLGTWVFKMEKFAARYDNGSGYMEEFATFNTLEVAIAQADQVMRLGVQTNVDVIDESGNVVWSGMI
jgi:hypothetical protein